MLKRIILSRQAGNVRRYHTRELLKEETVSQHTFNMLNILMIVTDRQIMARLLMAVVAHDMGEYATGDVPSPVKRATKELSATLNEMEDKAMREIHTGLFSELTDWEYKLLKFADCLDGLMKVCHEQSLGNRTMREVGANYLSYLYSMEDLGPTMGDLLEEAREEFYRYD